jgi:hypothetical protein
MKALLKRASLLGSLCAVVLMACTAASVRVELGHFGLGTTDGIWLWKAEGTSYVRLCRIDISDPFVQNGREVVSYLQSCLDDRPESVEWLADVERQPDDSATVQLVLLYQRYGNRIPHRATAFNDAGESVLSTASVLL